MVETLANLARSSTAQVTMTGSLEGDLNKYPGLWGEVSLLMMEMDVIEKGVKSTIDLVKSNG